MPKSVMFSTNISTITVPTPFFARMTQHTYQYMLGVEDTDLKFEVPFINLGGGIINIARAQQVEHFIEDSTAEWFFNVDCDETWGPNGISTLIETGGDILSAPVFLKHAPFLPNFFHWDGKNLEVPTGPIPDEPFEVDAVGFGFIAIHRPVLEVLWHVHRDSLFRSPKRHKWGDILLGEDVAFSYYAKQQGFSITVNPSIEVKHLTYTEVGRQQFDNSRQEVTHG